MKFIIFDANKLLPIQQTQKLEINSNCSYWSLAVRKFFQDFIHAVAPSKTENVLKREIQYGCTFNNFNVIPDLVGSFH